MSVRVDLRALPILLVLILATLAVTVLSMGLGEYRIPPAEVLKAVVGGGGTAHDFIVNGLRLPRNLVALAVGVAAGTAGAILQGITRNPLAAPEVLGVTAGANLAAVTVVILLPEVPITMLPAAAFGGALGAAALVYVLAWSKGMAPVRLLLVGIGVAAAAQGLVAAVVTSAQVFYASQVVAWMAGSVYGRTWVHLRPLAILLAVLVPISYALARHLDALQLGDEVARGLGARVEAIRAALLFVGLGLAAGAVATAGPVAFVGLMAPHAARLLTGASHAAVLPASGLIGGLMVVVADAIGRALFAPIEIPVGVVTPLVGVPYFLYLLKRTRAAEGAG